MCVSTPGCIEISRHSPLPLSPFPLFQTPRPIFYPFHIFDIDTQIIVNYMYESAAQRQFRIPNIIIKITMHPLRISEEGGGGIRVMPPRRGDRDGVIGLYGALPRCDGEWMDWERCFSWHYGRRFRSPANGGCKSVSLGIQFALMHIAETAEFSLFAVCHYRGIRDLNCACSLLRNKNATSLWWIETARMAKSAALASISYTILQKF